MNRDNTIFLFDIDGTLTPSRLKVSNETLSMISKLRKKVTIGIVGGSDFEKQKDQLGDNVLDLFDYSFSENGLVAFHGQELIHKNSFLSYLGEQRLSELINWTLHYIANLDIPKKRGCFIEYRTGMINICPIGRNCSQDERIEFYEYDKIHNIRSKMVDLMIKEFGERFQIKFSIGGQISFDVFPIGWDKTYCLRHIPSFNNYHFFGDKTDIGGNDYEIYNHTDVIGHTVINPEDTIKQVNELINN